MSGRGQDPARGERTSGASRSTVEPRERHIRVARTARYYTLGLSEGAGESSGDRPAGAATTHDVRTELLRPAGRGGPGEPRPAGSAPREIWFVCHGYRQLAGRFVRRFAPLDDGNRLIVAPEALSRFYLDDDGGPHGPDARIGATWMTRADRENEIRDYVDYLDTLYDRVFDDSGLDRDAVRVHLLGFSQGAATASRWAALGRSRIDRLTLWAGRLAHDLDLDDAADRLRDVGLTFVIGTEDPFATPGAMEREVARLEREHGIGASLMSFEGGHRMDDETLLELARS